MHMWHVIQEYCLAFPMEAMKLLEKTRFLESVIDPFPRDLLPGHITGSGILIRNEKMLLIHHRYIKEWFQPGGHIDPGESPLEGAIREVAEETGWQSMPSSLWRNDLPIDIDVHIIPANPKKQEPEHLHIDFAFLLEPVYEGIASDPESIGWFDLTSCSAERLTRCVEKFQRLNRAQ